MMNLISLSASFMVLFGSLGGPKAFAFTVPPLKGPVQDEAGLLSRSQQQSLEEALRKVNSEGTAQIQIAILKNLQGEPIESASIQIVDAWKLGDAKKDNGVLFLISVEDKKMRIEVGQGLEGVLPDITTKRILADDVRPLFRSQQFVEGIFIGTQKIIQRVRGENPAPEDASGSSQKKKVPPWTLLIYLILFVLFFFGRLFGGGRRLSGSRRSWGGGLGGGNWHSSGGSGGWSGGGSGGWSGGGGGFSGGGASSDW